MRKDTEWPAGPWPKRKSAGNTTQSRRMSKLIKDRKGVVVNYRLARNISIGPRPEDLTGPSKHTWPRFQLDWPAERERENLAEHVSQVQHATDQFIFSSTGASSLLGPAGTCWDLSGPIRTCQAGVCTCAPLSSSSLFPLIVVIHGNCVSPSRLSRVSFILLLYNG